MMSSSLIVCVFSGAVELRLEQEGEAQLCSECRGLYSQVQPGETHIHFSLLSQAVFPPVSPTRKEKKAPYVMLKIYVLWSSRMGEITAPLSILSSASILQALNHHPSSPRAGCFEALLVMAAPNNLLPASHIRHNYSPGDTGL